MHSALHRGNALFTAATTTLAIVAVLAALSDWRLSSAPFARLQFADEAPPLVSASLSAWEGLAPPSQTLPVGDRAWPRLDVRIDLRPLWHWNVKQTFVWVSASVSTPSAPRSDAVLFSAVASSRALGIKNPVSRKGKAGGMRPFTARCVMSPSRTTVSTET